MKRLKEPVVSYKTIFWLFSLTFLLVLSYFVSHHSKISRVTEAQSGPGMYPRSDYLIDIQWDQNKIELECGDNAATTWATNDKLYGSLGDCNSSFNLLEISGNPPALTKLLLNPQVDGMTWDCCGYEGGKQKSASLLAIGNTLYSLQRNFDGRNGVGLVVSTDGGKNFTFNPQQIRIKLGYPTFINYGKGNEGAIDNYIYIWGHGCEDTAYAACERMHMIRVQKDQILNKNAYEYFAKTGSWVKSDPGVLDLSINTPMATVFSCKDSGKCDRSGITYNPALGRYIVWMSDWNGTDDFRNPGTGGLGIYESPTPWLENSWKMVWHTPTNNGGWGIFSDDGIGDAGVFTTKWMSIDGKEMYLAYGGNNKYSLRKATFVVNTSPALTVTPTIPTGSCTKKVQGDADCNGKIDLSDFETFRKEYTGSLSTKAADFDASGQVTLGDFETWRRGFFSSSQNPTPTLTSSPPTVTPTRTPTVPFTPTPTGTTGNTLKDRLPELFSFAETQLTATTQKISATSYPTNTKSSGDWNTTSSGSWTSGFFPGALWLLYEKTQTANWRTNAEKWTAGIEGQKNDTSTHDLGFMFYDSFGNGYRLTNNANYKNILLAAAHSLATRYSATVGCIKSWDGASNEYKVIIDNMMNLELLFWASKNGGDQAWYNMALSHALKTSQNHVRPDGSTYHVVIYDPANGAVKSRVTAQGYSDSSTWSRGQAWAIYGFSIAYRETNDVRFLDTARKTADYFISHLPADHIPYWDFQAPGIPNEPRDSSAAAIAASGLLELSKLETDTAKKQSYAQSAETILNSLSQSPYLAKGTSYKSLLLHGTQNKPGGNYDTGLIFGDYYYLEALLKYQKM